MSEFEVILAAITSGGVGAALMKGVEIWQKIRKELNEPIIQRTVENSKKIYQLLNMLKADTDGVRACLLRAHNGGSTPKTGTPTYTTMAYETYDNDQSPIQQNWNARPVDEDYVNMLSQLLTESQLVVEINSLPDNSLLKGTYNLSHVCFSVVTLVKVTPASVFYLSLHFDTEQMDQELIELAKVISKNYADQIAPILED